MGYSSKSGGLVIREIAACVEDEDLRTLFLNSPAVRDIFKPLDRSAGPSPGTSVDI